MKFIEEKFSFNSFISLIWNLLLVYACFFMCRIIFIWENYSFFAEALSAEGFRLMLKGGFRFDTAAILYTNIIYILLMTIPIHYKELRIYQNITKWLFVATNAVALTSNLIDSVYFQYTNRRSTATVFREFQNENNLGNIFGREIVSHWYLAIAVIVFIFILVKAYRPSCLPAKEIKYKTYYPVQSILFLLSIALCIGGMRGGFTTAIRPITISNANQYVNHPIETAIVLNTPFSIYRTLDKEVFTVPDYYSDREEMLSYFSPVHLPADSARFKPMNVVVLIMESFNKEYFGTYNPALKEKGQTYTPFLDSLIEKSLTFEHSFANGRKSIDAMPSVLSGIPMFVEPFFVTPSSLNDLSSIGGELKKKGYYTAFFHGAENGSMGFQAYARTSGYSHYFGRTEFNNDKEFDGTWAIWDEPFLQFYADEISQMKEPFAVGVFTATSHHPFRIPDGMEDRFLEGTMPIHKCIRYSDNALRLFFNKASTQPWYQNTLFVIVADHTNKGDTPEFMTEVGRFKVPIIFFQPNDTTLRGKRNGLSQQIDIMPTVLSYLEYDQPYIAFGCDLLHTSVEKQFAVNYSNGLYQYYKGNYALQFDGKKSVALYDYVTDALLKNNLVGTLPIQDQMEKELKSIVQQYMERMTKNQLIYSSDHANK